MTTIETIQRAERRAITLTKNGSADAEHARGSVYKLAGEQARRAETIRQRDAANRSARVCLASADAAEKDAERLSREARALIRDFNGSKVTQDKIDTLATSATERRSYAEAQRAAVSEHSRRAGKLTAQIARMPHGNRRIRRAAERASVKVRNAAARCELGGVGAREADARAPVRGVALPDRLGAARLLNRELVHAAACVLRILKRAG